MIQRSFEELGTPLAEVTFCVVDLETTGGSPESDAITEIGALKVRRGETIGSLQTLVNPGSPVPAFIKLLTGIDDDMLLEAPNIEAVLPSLQEFCKDTVLVAHNARFDVGFLNSALLAADRPPLDNQVVDTARLARKILGGEVPNHRLETLARHLRCAHRPCHRAFADVLATVDVLHHLIERVAGFGVTTLQDLLSMTTVRLDGTFSKIRLTDGLPRGPGVYRFLGPTGNTLYIGKATDVRSRVRSYFYGDTRSRMRDLIRETQSIEATGYPSLLEAEIVEARAIAAERPPYNRSGKRPAKWYLRFAGKKVRPARVLKEGLHLGPFPRKTVMALIEALQDAAPLHRCAQPCKGCAFGEMGTCRPDEQTETVERLIAAVRSEHDVLLRPLRRKMLALAQTECYERAADLRERGSLLARTLHSFAALEGLRRAGRVIVQEGGRALCFEQGTFVAATDAGPGAVQELLARPLGSEHDDARLLLAYLKRAPERVSLLFCSGQWSMPIGCGPDESFVKKSAGDTSDARHAVE